MALAITDDQAAQERVWDSSQEWERRPATLRRALTESKVDAITDPRARFVGVEAYTQAGGQIERDLFQPEHQGYLTDPDLLDQLTREKLEVLAEKVRGEGWKWVEINPHVDYSDLTKFKRIYPVHAASLELRSQIEALEEEQEKINETYQDADKYPPDVDKRMAEIEERIEELNEQTQQYREEEKKLAGAVVSIDSIHRGLVRPEDKRKAEAAKLGGDTGNPTGEGEEPKEEVELSAALVEDLTANRTAALRAVLATRPDVALVAVTHALALQVCYEAMHHFDAGSACL